LAEETLESAETSLELVTEAYELFEAGQIERALEGFNEALEKDASSVVARLGQAMIYQEQQRHQEAFDSYDFIVQRHPSHAFAWNGRGLAAYNLEDFDLALTSFKQATADEPVNGYFYESMAWTYMCRGEFPEAAIAARQATLMYNQNGEIPAYPLLIAYFAQIQTGDKDDARRTLNYARQNRIPNEAWPSPIFEYLSGKFSASELISHVKDRAQETEAHTYIGMHLRSLGENEKGAAHLDWVAAHGDQRVFEYTLARSLKASNGVALATP